MSIEIDILNGGESWPMVEPLFNAVWPPDAAVKPPWAGFTFAYPELRVLVQTEPDGVVCHVGLQRRDATWNGRKVRIGGIGGVATREAFRRRGLASMALDAAIQTLKDEGSADFALLFCEPHHAAFYTDRGWKPFEGDVWAEQPGGRVRFDVTTPYVYGLKRAPLKGTIDLCGLPW